ncbi:uncharacterized protein LOC106661535 [Cimex lectularius]|uniref:Uncharacterized protein n=1 Tax=Cimex lectularius TaxID=79782 RepID=A0A8I6R8H5_CIMLE|nr:uncharacterized protein LOC106661535 [Cimex lectularius]
MEPEKAESAEQVANGQLLKSSVKFTEYFQMTIKPLLEEGKDGELIDWLKDIGLLKRSQKCTNPDCQGTKPMEWKRARIVDKFHWSCPLCKKKVSIRNDSPLAEFHCSFKIILDTITAWCDGVSLEEFTKENKTVKGVIAKRIYSTCTNVANWYMQNHQDLSYLGGDNTVVLLDTFPDGCMTTTPHNNNYGKRVLCMADTSHMPARIWTQIIDNKSLDYHKLSSLVAEHIRPGSTVVASPGLFPLLHGTKGMAEVISVDALTALDPIDYQRSLKNLETIWKSTVSVCQEIQNLSNTEGEQTLRELEWRQVFPTPLAQILHDIASYANARVA